MDNHAPTAANPYNLNYPQGNGKATGHELSDTVLSRGLKLNLT
jgi:hypothetical protein